MGTKLPKSFDTKNDDRRMGFKVMPAGDYTAKIVETTRKATKETATLAVSKRKYMYTLVWEIAAGVFKGQKIFDNLNLEHEVDKTREYAEERLLSVQEACGVTRCDDLDDLKGFEINIKVSVTEANAKYAASNGIRDYSSLKGVKKPAAGAAKTSRFEDDEEDEKPAPKTTQAKPAGARKVSF